MNFGTLKMTGYIWDWNMDSSEGSHIPSTTLDYDTGEGYYKTIFE